MDLSALTIDPAEAKAKLDEYRHTIDGERTVEDMAIAAGYRAAARGLPIISLARTITGGGFHPNSLPKIAVIRADAAECYVRWDSYYSSGELVFSDVDDRHINHGAWVNKHSVRVEIPGDARPDRSGKNMWVAGRAMPPLIPPQFRPSRRRVHRFHLLWEVEAWEWVPPEDPALIKHIRGDLWSVHAVWQLTQLERLVLTQR